MVAPGDIIVAWADNENALSIRVYRAISTVR